MIKIITYILIFFMMIVTSFAQVKTEEITINNHGIELPGTLTYTKENKPLLIWIHGSGGVKRTGGVTKYITQFREEINKNNLAFFSYDKRTSNPKNIVFLKEGILFDDFVSDAKKVIQHFKKENRFSKIILVGHSQGSLISMLISKNVDKFISLAGPGETIDKTLIRQITEKDKDLGKVTENHFKELLETNTIKEVNPNLMVFFAPQNQSFFKQWMQIDPIVEIKKITIPTLIINGDKDLQVFIKDAKALHKAKPNAELAIIKNMTHLCKHITTDADNIKSYSSADFPISEELIKTVVNFVKK